VTKNLKASRKNPLSITSNKIGITFLVAGILLMGFSLFVNSQILALIGLGLTFWGALFFFITPTRYIESALLEETAFSAYLLIDRIILNLEVEGKGYYIPPYPKDVFLPEHLKGLKDAVVFVPKEDTLEMPPLEEIAKARFEGSKLKGVFLTAPGSELLDHLEKKSRVDLYKVTKDELLELLPDLIINQALANEIKLFEKDEEIRLTLRDSVYQNLYSLERGLKSAGLLGCPIASAVACALAKSTGKRVFLQGLRTSIETHTTMITFRVVQDVELK
jgi:hypothetical protein